MNTSILHGRLLWLGSKLAQLATGASMLTSACTNQLTLRQTAAKAERPANVAVLFQVTSRDKVVTDLTRKQILITDDRDQPIPEDSWTLANPDLRNRVEVALLLDLGGSPTPNELTQLNIAVLRFTQKLGTGPQVAVYAFDGAAEPRVLVPFETRSSDLPQLMRSLERDPPRDPSTDLHGAYLRAYRDLSQRIEGNPLAMGALVLIARGPDRASRVTADDLAWTIGRRPTSIDRYLIAIGAAAQGAGLDWLSTRPSLYVPNTLNAGQAIERIAAEIEARGRSRYLLFYCTPARAGRHRLTIEVQRPDGALGELSYSYDATGFGPGCHLDHVDAVRWEADSSGTD